MKVTLPLIPAWFALTALLISGGCSLPRVVIHTDPLSAVEHNDLGYALEKQNQLKLARKEYGRAIEADATWPLPLFNAGNIEYRLGRFSEALSLYQRAQKLDPDNPDIMNNMAWVYYRLGRLQEAGAWIDRALALRRQPEFLDTAEKIERAKKERK